MQRIRTKLMLSLLAVSLIPILPSYYLVKSLVDQSFEIGFNSHVEQALEGAAKISGDLYGRYRRETLERVTTLARVEKTMQWARNVVENTATSRSDSLSAAALTGWQRYRIDLYDRRANLLTSLGVELEQESALGLGEETVRSLSQRQEPMVVQEGDPRRIVVYAPIVDGATALGFIIVTREIEQPFAQFARRIVDANQLFKTLDYYTDEVKFRLLGLFLFFYVTITVLSVGVGYIFSRRFTSPLLTLVKGTQAVAAGDLEYRIAVSSQDEIGQLMQAFNQMVADIKINQALAHERGLERQRLEDENQRRAKDLEMSELRERTLQAENERQTIELEKTQELERAYGELEDSHQQLQQAQTQLILQEKMASLGSMVAGVAHEINNPIGVVHSAVDVSGRCIERIEEWLNHNRSHLAAGDTKALTRAITALKDSVKVTREAEVRISSVVRSLKSFAHIDEAEFQMADLCVGLDDALNLLADQLGSGIEIERLYGEIELTHCSPSQLNQAFMNVLKNAVQAIEDKGVIRVGVSQAHKQITVRISDTGIGIAPDKLRRVFDLGFSAKSTRVKMGSGLSMAYRIIQDHGGEIEIESIEGEGTEVIIRLPIRQEAVQENTTA